MSEEKKDKRHYVTKNGKRTNLPPEMQGRMKNPEVQAQMQVAKNKALAERKAKKEALLTGFEQSKASDPAEQAKLIDKLWEMAMSDSKELAKFAIKTLNDMGVIKQPTEKPIEPKVEAEEKFQPDQAISILKLASKDEEDE